VTKLFVCIHVCSSKLSLISSWSSAEIQTSETLWRIISSRTFALLLCLTAFTVIFLFFCHQVFWRMLCTLMWFSYHVKMLGHRRWDSVKLQHFLKVNFKYFEKTWTEIRLISMIKHALKCKSRVFGQWVQCFYQGWKWKKVSKIQVALRIVELPFIGPNLTRVDTYIYVTILFKFFFFTKNDD